MRLRPINAPDASQPLGGYVQAMEASGATRLLFVSGQIPTEADGAVPEDFASQARLAWRNVVAQLRAADMTLDNLVKVTIFLSDRRYIPEYREARLEALQGREVVLTTIIIGVFNERWLIEIDAVAAA
jgi:enamine deaminase RidA (YjgF/YER057c/UK114 family)